MDCNLNAEEKAKKEEKKARRSQQGKERRRRMTADDREKERIKNREKYEHNRERKKANAKAWYENNKEKSRAINRRAYLKRAGQPRKLSERLLDSKQNASRRDLAWEITDEAAMVLFQEPCFYCNKAPDTKRWNGIDRADNSKGYVEGNCASACWPCNLAKGTMSVEDFVMLCHTVAAHHPKKAE